MLVRFRDALSGRIKDVRVTRRLSTSPACLVSEEFEMSRHLERILDAAGQKVDSARPILEINPDHPMVARLAAETEASRQSDWANLIFDQALLSEGGRLEDPAAFVRRMNELIVALAAGGEPGAGAQAGEEEDGEEDRREGRWLEIRGLGHRAAGLRRPAAVFPWPLRVRLLRQTNQCPEVTAHPCWLFVRLRSCSGPWIPAFAGMTGNTPDVPHPSFPRRRESIRP